MTSKAASIEEYLGELPEDRRAALSTVREAILANLPDGYEEGMQYGMIGYYVPHSRYPAGYSCDPKQPLPFAALGSQKNHMSLHLMCAYMNEEMDEWLRSGFEAAGKRLDMGKACIRFKKAEDLPLDLIGQAFARVPVDEWIATCERVARTRKK